jgi:hypothetical protein
LQNAQKTQHLSILRAYRKRSVRAKNKSLRDRGGADRIFLTHLLDGLLIKKLWNWADL